MLVIQIIPLISCYSQTGNGGMEGNIDFHAVHFGTLEHLSAPPTPNICWVLSPALAFSSWGTAHIHAFQLHNVLVSEVFHHLLKSWHERTPAVCSCFMGRGGQGWRLEASWCYSTALLPKAELCFNPRKSHPVNCLKL